MPESRTASDCGIPISRNTVPEFCGHFLDCAALPKCREERLHMRHWHFLIIILPAGLVHSLWSGRASPNQPPVVFSSTRSGGSIVRNSGWDSMNLWRRCQKLDQKHEQTVRVSDFATSCTEKRHNTGDAHGLKHAQFKTIVREVILICLRRLTPLIDVVAPLSKRNAPSRVFFS